MWLRAVQNLGSWTLDLGPWTAKQRLQRGFVVFAGLVPVDHVPDRLEVVGTAVLVVEVVGVFAHVHTEDRLAFDAGDGLAHDGAILVRRGADLEAVRGDEEPCPAAAETASAGGFELGLELVEAAELRRDGLGKLAGGLTAAVRAEQGPEKAVVGMAAAVVA